MVALGMRLKPAKEIDFVDLTKGDLMPYLGGR